MSWLSKKKKAFDDWYADTSMLVDTIYDSKVKEFVDKKHEARARRHEKWKKDHENHDERADGA